MHVCFLLPKNTCRFSELKENIHFSTFFLSQTWLFSEINLMKLVLVLNSNFLESNKNNMTIEDQEFKIIKKILN